MDALLGELAAAQHGRFATWQALALGLTRDHLRRRVEAGRLHREHRGVYAVGHPGATADARRMSAVLACGPRALLSCGSLAHHLDLLQGPGPATIHVTAAGRSRAGHPGIRLHLPRLVSRAEVTTVRGVPCTTVERMLADLAGEAGDADLATVVHRAQVRGLIRPEPMQQQLARMTTGVRRLRTLIEPTGPDLRQELERRFYRFVRNGGWPPYEANVLMTTPLGQLRFDVLWRELGFGLELDSWRHHGDRDAFEVDRRRVVAADLVGIDLKRVTWRMLVGTPEVLAALLDHRVGRSSASSRRL